MIEYNQQSVLLNDQQIKQLVMSSGTPKLRHEFERDNAEIGIPEYSIKFSNISNEAVPIVQSNRPASIKHYASGSLFFNGSEVEGTDYDSTNMELSMRFTGIESKLGEILSDLSLRTLTDVHRSNRIIAERYGFHTTGVDGLSAIFRPSASEPGNAYRISQMLGVFQGAIRSHSDFATLTIVAPAIMDTWFIIDFDQNRPDNNHIANQFSIPDWNALDLIYEMCKATNSIFYYRHTPQQLVIAPKRFLVIDQSTPFVLQPLKNSIVESLPQATQLMLQWKSRESARDRSSGSSNSRQFGNRRWTPGVSQTLPPWGHYSPGQYTRGDTGTRTTVELDFDQPFVHDPSGILGIPRNVQAHNQSPGPMRHLAFRNIYLDVLFPINLTDLGAYWYEHEFPTGTPLKHIKLDHSLLADDTILSQWPLAGKKCRFGDNTFIVSKYELDFGKEILTLEGMTVA